MAKYKRLADASYTAKLYVAMLLVGILPLILLIWVNSSSMSSTLMRQTSYANDKAYRQVLNHLEDRTRVIKGVVDIISADASIQNLATLRDDPKSGADASSVMGNWMFSGDAPRQLVFNGYLDSYLSRVSLYLAVDDNAFETSADFLRMGESLQRRVTAWLADGVYGYCWIAPDYESNSLFFLSKIPNARKLNSSLGVIKGDASISTFRRIMENALTSPNATLMLVNGNGEVFLSVGSSETSERAVLAVDGWKAAGGSALLRDVTLDKAGYQVGVSGIEYSDWQLVYLVPYADTTSTVSSYRNTLLLYVALIVLLLVPTFFWLSRSFTKRLRALAARMNTASEGELRQELPQGANDEVGQLIGNFNHMMRRTHTLLEESYTLGQALKSAELHVLQEQINPHFLYNTLDMIHWMALRSGASDIDKVVTELSTFYKLSLSSGADTVTLEREIAHVTNYVSIQNIRFAGMIDLRIDVPQELLKCAVLKILLQPLVENAIQHGIREREEEGGTIEISAADEDQTLVLRVKDNGVGIPPDVLKEICDSGELSGHYGIHNINERLFLHYGKQSMLHYESIWGEGTTVTLAIPKTRM